MAWIHLSRWSALSNDTLMMFSPFSWYLLYTRTTFGFSMRHGRHHEAQKSMMVYFPNVSERDRLVPSGVGAVNSGAKDPISAFPIVAKVDSNSFVNSDDAISGLRFWR